MNSRNKHKVKTRTSRTDGSMPTMENVEPKRNPAANATARKRRSHVTRAAQAVKRKHSNHLVAHWMNTLDVHLKRIDMATKNYFSKQFQPNMFSYHL